MKDVRNAAIYIRVSSEMQEDDGVSLDTQLDMCMEAAAKHGFTVPEDCVFRDVVSGRTNNRPALRRLLDAMKAGQLQAVVFYDITRLSRSVYWGQEILQASEAGNCSLYTVGGHVDTQTPEGEFMVNLHLSLGQLESRKIAKRVKDTLYTLVQPTRPGVAPKWAGGGIPYGYRRHVEPDGSVTLVPDEYRADILRQIFQWAADGLGTGQIAKRLHNMGVPTNRGGVIWRPQAVKRILLSPAYQGIQRFGEARGDWPYERIVTEELALAAYKAAESRFFQTGPHTVKHPWSRLAVCGICKRRMTWNMHSRGYRYFRCAHYKEYWLERPDELPAHLMVNVDQMDALTDILLGIVARCQPGARRPAANLSDVEAQLQKVRDKRERCRVMRMDGDISPDEWEAVKAECRAKEAALVSQVPSERLSLPEAKRLPDIWDSLTVGRQNQWLRMLTEGVLVTEDILAVQCQHTGWEGWPSRIYIGRPEGVILRLE